MKSSYEYVAETENATQLLAHALASVAQTGDVIALGGDLGAGKTAFARAFIRAVTQQPDLEVPSPTFTLVQTYEGPDAGTIFHSDLYRLSDPEGLEDLGLDDERDTAVFLFEWPDRLTHWWRDGALDIMITIPDPAVQGARHFFLSCDERRWGHRMKRLVEQGMIAPTMDASATDD